MMNRAILAAFSFLVALLPLTAHGQWQPDGALVCMAIHNQTGTVAVSDGAGGAIIAWTDARNGSGGDIYAQRVDSWGNALWTSDGVALCTQAADQSYPSILSDGAGGAIVAWNEARNYATTNFDLYAQCVNASGVVQWTTDGVALCTASGGQYYAKMTSNGSNGAIVVWDDYRAGSLNSDVYATRLTSVGAALDGSGGFAVSSRLTNEGSPLLTPYGGGGAIIAWTDSRNGLPDIFAARVSSIGVVLDPSGIALCQSGGEQVSPAAVGDGAGGAIIAWSDERVGGIYAQRINSAGAVQWTLNGVAVSSYPYVTSSFDLPRMLADGAGGALIVWSRYEGAGLNYYAERIDASGARQWLPDDVSVCTDPNAQNSLAMASDNAGGMVLVWEDNRGGLGYDIYAQRVESSGNVPWTANGIVVCDADFDQHEPAAVSDGSGGVIAAWHDRRNYFDIDIYALRVRADGWMPTGAGDAPSAVTGIQRIYPNPFNPETTIPFTLARTGRVTLRVFDVSGRMVATLIDGTMATGEHEARWNGRDTQERRVSSGVYIARLEASGSTDTRKLVLLK